MKLIIDIPEDVYTRLFENGIQDNEIATDDICEMARALRFGTPLPDERLSNSEWIGFLSEQFDISRTSAKEMLHVMMSVKREDNFKKQFNSRKKRDEER